jgi:DNA polymerase III delta prime subunit
MKVSELKAWVRRSIEKGHSLFIAGPPGCGKSEAVDQAVVELVRDMYPKMKMELIHSVTSSPTDAKGFPFANADRTAADFLPYGYLRQMIEATERLVIFFDDFGQAKEAVQASVMQMVLARAIGPHKISDNVVFIFATNRREDRAAVRGIIEPMKSRPLTILELEPDATEWCAYMKANRPNTQHLEDVIGFVR